MFYKKYFYLLLKNSKNKQFYSNHYAFCLVSNFFLMNSSILFLLEHFSNIVITVLSILKKILIPIIKTFLKFNIYKLITKLLFYNSYNFFLIFNLCKTNLIN